MTGGARAPGPVIPTWHRDFSNPILDDDRVKVTSELTTSSDVTPIYQDLPVYHNRATLYLGTPSHLDRCPTLVRVVWYGKVGTGRVGGLEPTYQALPGSSYRAIWPKTGSFRVKYRAIWPKTGTFRVKYGQIELYGPILGV